MILVPLAVSEGSFVGYGGLHGFCTLQFFRSTRHGILVQVAVPVHWQLERRLNVFWNPRPRMDHVAAIRKYIEAMSAATDLHVLIVEGPAGWGKTTAVEDALRLAGVEGLHLGAYSTPLNLYNCLAENLDRIILADDCSGIFNDQSAMAILKAATWPLKGDRRIVKWGSTSSKAAASEFEFRGKLIIVCNSFPNTPDGEAIRSRGYVRRIDITLDEAKTLLRRAALNPRWFESTELAAQVADFLAERLTEESLPQVSFRTLKKGYRLAECHPDAWEELFADSLPKGTIAPEKLIKELSKKNLKVKDQARIFQEKTGLKVRSFYNYRKEAKLSRRASSR